MENSFKGINWKLLILVAILFLAIIFGSIFFLISRNTSQTQAPVNWKSHQDYDYQISYPSYIKATPGNIVGGGKSLIFQEKDEQDYHLELQVMPTSLTNAQNIASIFRSYNIEERELKLGGVTAIEFKGKTELPDQVFQEKVLVFEHKGQVYKLQLSYRSETSSRKLDELFDQIVQTIQVNQ